MSEWPAHPRLDTDADTDTDNPGLETDMDGAKGRATTDFPTIAVPPPDHDDEVLESVDMLVYDPLLYAVPYH